MTDDEIRELGLTIEGLKLKEQPDGSRDFNPYIYELVRAALARALASQWISVDERLPSDDSTYLVAVKNWPSHIDTDRFCADDSSWEFFNNSRLPKITHWMSLPNPPKGD